MAEGALDARERILAAAVACVEEHGVRTLSLEQVAAKAGASRTTIYRYFPGGRSQLMEEAATWEVARFWQRVAIAVADEPSIEDRLTTGLIIGRKVMNRSPIMTNLMDSEVQELISALEPSEPLIQALVRGYIEETLTEEAAAGRLREGVDVELAADYLCRMVLSWLASPGEVDLTDEATTRELVRTQLLAGLLPVDHQEPTER